MTTAYIQWGFQSRFTGQPKLPFLIKKESPFHNCHPPNIRYVMGLRTSTCDLPYTEAKFISSYRNTGIFRLNYAYYGIQS